MVAKDDGEPDMKKAKFADTADETAVVSSQTSSMQHESQSSDDPAWGSQPSMQHSSTQSSSQKESQSPQTPADYGVFPPHSNNVKPKSKQLRRNESGASASSASGQSSSACSDDILNGIDEKQEKAFKIFQDFNSGSDVFGPQFAEIAEKELGTLPRGWVQKLKREAPDFFHCYTVDRKENDLGICLCGDWNFSCPKCGRSRPGCECVCNECNELTNACKCEAEWCPKCPKGDAPWTCQFCPGCEDPVNSRYCWKCNRTCKRGWCPRCSRNVTSSTFDCKPNLVHCDCIFDDHNKCLKWWCKRVESKPGGNNADGANANEMDVDGDGNGSSNELDNCDVVHAVDGGAATTAGACVACERLQFLRFGRQSTDYGLRNRRSTLAAKRFVMGQPILESQTSSSQMTPRTAHTLGEHEKWTIAMLQKLWPGITDIMVKIMDEMRRMSHQGKETRWGEVGGRPKKSNKSKNRSSSGDNINSSGGTASSSSKDVQ